MDSRVSAVVQARCIMGLYAAGNFAKLKVWRHLAAKGAKASESKINCR